MNNMGQEIKSLWNLIPVGDSSLLEMRGIWPSGIPNRKPAKVAHFYVPDYESPDDCRDAFEKAAIQLNLDGYNVYVVMNPIRPNLATGNAKDADITYRHLMLVDIDRVEKMKLPANQAELDAAEGLARNIRSYMSEWGWPDPIVVMSGNGYHLYYALENLGNDDDSTKLVQTTLNNLAFTFDNDIVEVDTSVYNASRITKVPGTIARKGLESECRPYRMARVCYDF